MKTMVYNYPHPIVGPHFLKVYQSENATQLMFRHNKHHSSRENKSKQNQLWDNIIDQNNGLDIGDLSTIA